MRGKRTFAAMAAIVAVLLMLAAAYGLFYGGRVLPANGMTNHKDNSELFKEYSQLKKQLDERYLSDFCDIFEKAKSSLKEKAAVILGDDYARLNNEAIAKRDEITFLRDKLSESEEMVKLKDELMTLKESLIECADEQKRTEIREKTGEVLKAITKKNLDNFSLMSQKKKELDEIVAKLTAIANSKKDELKAVEKLVFGESKNSLASLSFAYRDEIDALAAAFGVTDYDGELPFLKMINLDMRLTDFNKQAFIAAYKEKIEHKHGHTHSHCPHDCSSCHSSCGSQCDCGTEGGKRPEKEKGERGENFFVTEDDKGDKN
ncbi:MAG TPA: hypothetical protein DDY77_04540 [Clostridiales bacterium]|nr:hypothetical protein [Clostridiales bacterium]